jgi:hypothetical protein
MATSETIDDSIVDAVERIQHFLKEVTGEKATQQEIAKALTHYFVMNEIKEYVEMNREAEM